MTKLNAEVALNKREIVTFPNVVYTTCRRDSSVWNRACCTMPWLVNRCVRQATVWKIAGICRADSAVSRCRARILGLVRKGFEGDASNEFGKHEMLLVSRCNRLLHLLCLMRMRRRRECRSDLGQSILLHTYTTIQVQRRLSALLTLVRRGELVAHTFCTCVRFFFLSCMIVH